MKEMVALIQLKKVVRGMGSMWQYHVLQNQCGGSGGVLCLRSGVPRVVVRCVYRRMFCVRVQYRVMKKRYSDVDADGF